MEKLKTLDEYLKSYDGIISQRIDMIEQGYSLSLIEEMAPQHLMDEEGYNSKKSGNSSSESFHKIDKKIQTIMGLVPTKNILKLQKLLFRISRGNIILKSRNLPLFSDLFLDKKKIEEKTLIFLIIPKTE